MKILRMNRYFLLACLLSVCVWTQAQNCEIGGSVFDSITHEPLAYCNISVLNSNDSVVSGCMSNEKGEFRIKYIQCNKHYKLMVSYTGYSSVLLDLPETLPAKYTTGNVFLSPSVMHLNEAVVEGTTRYMEQKFDRKVYTMNESKVLSAKSIFDLLRTLPGVTVDEDGNVKYKGAPATIYIDDMPSQYIYPKTEMIPVAQVIKIEVIDAALQSGSGKGGIINIKMKSMATDGISGMAQAKAATINFKDLNSGSGFANLNYKTGNFLVFANGNYVANNEWGQSENSGTLQFGETTYQMNSISSRTNKANSLWTYGGLRYSPSENTRMFFSLGLYDYGGSYPTVGNSSLVSYANGSYYDKYSQWTVYDYKYINKWLNAYFYHRFDTVGRELSVYAGIQDQQNDYLSEVYYYHEFINGSPVFHNTSNSTVTGIASRGIWAGAYYNHPINNLTRWNLGYRSWIPLSNVMVEDYTLDGDDYLPNSGTTLANTPSHTLYSRFGTTVKKWKFDAGVSVDYSRNKVDYQRYNEASQDTAFSVDKKYLHLTPSATIIYSADSLNDIKLTYSRNVEAPYYNQISSYIDKQDPRNWSSGNPDLKPIVYHNIYLGWQLNKLTWNINTDLFYSLTTNEVSYLTLPVNEVVYLTIPQNIAHKSSLGADISAWTSIKNKVDLNFSSSIFHTLIDAENLNENLKKKSFGYSLKLSSDIRFAKRTSANVYINYYSREITVDGYSYGYFDSSVSLTQKFFRNSLMLTVGVNSLLNDLLKHGSYTEYGGFQYYSYTYSATYKPTYFVSVKYNFRQGDRGTQNAGKM